MPEVVTRGITLHYDTFGDARDPAVLLIMGLGTQMIAWRTSLCESLARRGLFVVRFDNRDVGLSTKLLDAPVPSIPRTYLLRSLGLARPVYTLSDMAGDVVGLCDALGLRAAHVVGASMGGMIAQTFAIEHPERTLSLTSIMSSPGDRELPAPTLAATRVLLRPAPTTREQAIEHVVGLFRVIGSPAYFDEAQIRARAAEAHDRSPYRLGSARQLAAILTAPPRSRALRDVRVPATIVHGALDPLVRLAHGRATAAALPNAELRIIDDMAHDLPEPRWPEIVEAISRSVTRA